jgi:deoxyribose-phosphate aldolase
LEGTDIKTATVIGFPFGYSSTQAKLEEIKNALSDGADELDIVHNLAGLKHGDWNYLEHEVATATKMVHEAGKQIKVIIESGILEDDEIVKCCELYGKHSIDFMKTSTGYAATGATLHAVQLMRKNLPADMGIKASGGIRNFAFAKELVDAGATRLGCSASVQIVKEAENKQ